MDANRRRRTRVNVDVRVDVQTTGAWLRDVHTRDLSHKGVYLKGNHPLKAGAGCMVTLHLPGEAADAPVLRMEGKVIRATAEGTAIDFVSMDPDTFLHLRNLVLFHSEDPEQTEKEFGSPAFDAASEKDA